MNKPVVLEMGSSLHRGPVEECGGGGACLPGTLQLSQWKLFEASLEWGLLCCGYWRMYKGRLEADSSLLRGPVGEVVVGWFYLGLWNIDGGGLCYQICKGKIWKLASLHRGPFGEPGGLIYWGLSETVKELSVNGVHLCMGAVWGEPGGRAPLLGTLKAM
jgi:hypothetical protein